MVKGILEKALEDAWKTYQKQGGILSREEFTEEISEKMKVLNNLYFY